MNYNEAIKISGNELDEELKRIDLLNLRNNHYRYEVRSNDIWDREILQSGKLEAESRKDIDGELDIIRDENNFPQDQYKIDVYTWIPETLTQEGMWETIDEASIDEDTTSIHGKTVSHTFPIYDESKLKGLRIVFTDGQFLEVRGDNLINFVTPF